MKKYIIDGNITQIKTRSIKHQLQTHKTYLGEEFDYNITLTNDLILKDKAKWLKDVTYVFYDDTNRSRTKQLAIEVDTDKITRVKTHTFTDLIAISSNDDEMTKIFNTIINQLRASSAYVTVRYVVQSFITHVTKTTDPNLKISFPEAVEIVKKILHKSEYKIKLFRKDYKTSYLVFNFTSTDDSKFDYDFPLSIRPRPWTLNCDHSNAIMGGYISNGSNIADLITTSERNVIKKIKLTNRAISVVNAIHLQPFYINISSAISDIEKLIERNRHDLANKPMGLSVKAECVLTTHYEDVLSQLSYKLEAYKRFSEKMNRHEINKIYFNYKLDFRGRIYIAGSISPTSDKYLRDKLISANTNHKMIELDATASVLQVMATICNSKKLAEISNLITDTQKDPWTEIFDPSTITTEELDRALNSYYKNIVTGKNSKRFDSKSIDDFRSVITRNVIKMTIMTLVYGSNPFSISKSFRGTPDESCTWKHATAVLAIFHFKFPVEVKILGLIKKLNGLLIERFDVGLNVKNDYIEFSNTYPVIDDFKIAFTDSSNKRREVEIDICQNIVNKRKSNQALLANIFHNVDSQCCLSVSELFVKVYNLPILTIHDAFLINQCDVDRLKTTYNRSLFDQRRYLINLINNGLQLLAEGPPLNDKNLVLINKIKNILETLEKSYESYYLEKDNILSSKYALKHEV